MYLRIFLNLLLLVALFLVQISFVSGLPGWLNKANLIVIALVFILSIKSFRQGLWWAIGLGFFWEIFSFLPVGVYIFSLIAAVAAANFLLINVFTNRSLYSYLILSVAAIFVYEASLYFSSFLVFYFSKADFFFNIDKNFWLEKLSGIFIDILAVIFSFYSVNFISKNFKPVFLIKKPVIRRR